MHSISNKLFYRSAVALRRLWLLNCTRNARVIQSPLSCSAYRHVQLFTDEPITVDKSIKFPSNNLALQNVRFQSTAQGSESSVEAMEEKATSGDIMIKKFISILRVIAGPLMKKTVIIGSARNMYECCVDGMNFEEFFEACELPDTFQSWFIVLHLHVWMCLVRLKVEGKDGRYMYRKLVEMMWFDVEERMKNLGTIDSQVLRDNLRVLVKQFYGLTIALDEGLLCDDTVLATALWRNMFYNKKGTDAEALGRLVEYVRKNVQHLETYTTDHLLYNSGKLSWLPFKEEEEETAKEEGVGKE